MGLRRRALVAITAMSLIVLGAGVAGTMAVARGFDNAEHETLAEHVEAVDALIERTAETIAASARDYAFWNDTLEFVTGRYPDYPSEAIGDPADTLGSLGVDALIVLDADHEIVLGAHVVDGDTVDVPPDLADWARAAAFPSLGTSTTATTTIDGRPALAAIAGVTDSDQSTGPQGALIMARRLDDVLLADLSAASPARLSLDDPDADPGLRFPRPDTAIAGIPLRDLDGETTATLRATLDRPVATAARRSLRMLVVSMTAGLALAVGGFGYWLTIRVTRRIARLDGQVEQLRHGGGGVLRVEGDDEIARLGDNVQQLLHTVAELQRRRAEARLGTLIEHSSDIVVLTDASGIVRYATPALERTLGVDPAATIGRPVTQVLAVEDVPVLAANLERLAASTTDQTVTFEHDARTVDGDLRHLELVGMNRLDTDGVAGLVLTIRDQSERRRFEDELRAQALTDSLTGLPNRTLFHDRVEHALARRKREPDGWLAVIFLDLDDFKTVNDSLGHAAGDALLQAVGRLLTGCLRPSDTAARLGGDEFACLLEDVNRRDDVATVVERIQAALGDPVAFGDRLIRVEASIGVAFPDSGDIDADTLLRNADMAMYTAKTAGDGRHKVFAPEMHTDALRRLELKAAMAEALEQDQFRLVYQPIVDLATGNGVGAEALLRWHHPVRGEIGPLDFIPLAEETGFIVPLGRWVLHEACRRAATWQLPEGPPVHISVNVSVRQLTDDRIVDDVAQALAASGLRPALLQLELTESLFITDHDAIAATLGELKRLGVTIAVDDFGTGHSTLAYLRDFPIDVLKLDRSFVRSLDSSDPNGNFAAGVLTLARHLNLQTLAEGIEEGHQRDSLRTLDCQLGQGYLFARPAEAEQFEAWLAGHTGVPLSEPRST